MLVSIYTGLKLLGSKIFSPNDPAEVNPHEIAPLTNGVEKDLS
jgi:hypothetical protein